MQWFTPLLIDAGLACRHQVTDRWFVAAAGQPAEGSER